eukprot:CAMPEP_0175058696 /NCGR_PEP_ID=MMETSP0052_2-20121109/11997_1 /TAXON_ID=51329 ORGANISM="Polytomella parva, Strain SAG 63-3" /NCGR_SAMPLE_ID=MMETSP0052_2 /ASSEMBLY_ACC=CAM_ASM_000194 /LENGTH=181 /DNA_ID=CAMNT_0016324117 /DNA_START=149 /DNA_END=691 /DNA_ORIENTATION=+
MTNSIGLGEGSLGPGSKIQIVNRHNMDEILRTSISSKNMSNVNASTVNNSSSNTNRSNVNSIINNYHNNTNNVHKKSKATLSSAPTSTLPLKGSAASIATRGDFGFMSGSGIQMKGVNGRDARDPNLGLDLNSRGGLNDNSLDTSVPLSMALANLSKGLLQSIQKVHGRNLTNNNNNSNNN